MPLSCSVGQHNNRPSRKIVTNVYGAAGALTGNWYESRLEPEEQRHSSQNLNKLPGPTSSQWKTTSGHHGNWKAEAMRRSMTRTASDHWLPMAKPKSSDTYSTTAGEQLCHPSKQRSVSLAPFIPEDGGGRRSRNGSVGWHEFHLGNYRQTWTKSDSDRFAKPKTGFM
mmetsp:Transcript_14830/g.28025  ORF Transcript_14830/g.28025 Transcript_14830/m.28025 type:complete len:168 (-) Transcript_14830:21-524(-)